MENVSKSAIATKSAKKPHPTSLAADVKTEGGAPVEESKDAGDDQIDDETMQEVDDIEDMHGEYGAEGDDDDEDDYSENYEEELAN